MRYNAWSRGTSICVRVPCFHPPRVPRSRSVAEQYSLLPADRHTGREAGRKIKRDERGRAEWRRGGWKMKKSQNRVLPKNKPQKSQRFHRTLLPSLILVSLQNNRHLSHPCEGPLLVFIPSHFTSYFPINSDLFSETSFSQPSPCQTWEFSLHKANKLIFSSYTAFSDLNLPSHRASMLIFDGKS